MMNKKLSQFLIMFAAASCFALTGCTTGDTEVEGEEHEELKELVEDVVEGNADLPYGCGQGADYVCCSDSEGWCCADYSDGGWDISCGLF